MSSARDTAAGTAADAAAASEGRGVAPTFKRGERVECRYRGGPIWYAGLITGHSQRSGGEVLYAIAYDDGDKETAVPAALVRVHVPPSSGRTYEVGDLVEARFGGDADWFPGKIARASGGDTYDIAYDDGDAESAVATALIRARAS